MKIHHAGLAIVLAMGLAAPIAAQDPPHQKHTPGPAMSLHIQDDLDFVTTMLMHHEGGIEMSRIEVERGQSEEVKTLARKIMDGQQRESQELEAFKERLGDPRSAAQDARMPRHRNDETVQAMKQKMQAHMENLRAASGPEADKMFVTMMVRHHQHGLEMTQAVLPKLKDPDVRAFAQRTIENQKKEIDELKAVK
jgi:uncharacterized protein (DUF305 family)